MPRRRGVRADAGRASRMVPNSQITAADYCAVSRAIHRVVPTGAEVLVVSIRKPQRAAGPETHLPRTTVFFAPRCGIARRNVAAGTGVVHSSGNYGRAPSWCHIRYIDLPVGADQKGRGRAGINELRPFHLPVDIPLEQNPDPGTVTSRAPSACQSAGTDAPVGAFPKLIDRNFQPQAGRDDVRKSGPPGARQTGQGSGGAWRAAPPRAAAGLRWPLASGAGWSAGADGVGRAGRAAAIGAATGMEGDGDVHTVCF